MNAPGASVGERRQFVGFLMTGGFAACVNLAGRWLLSRVMSYELAIVIAYLVGMVFAFILAKRYVFESGSGSVAGEFARFALVNLASFLIVFVVSVGCARALFPAIGWTWHVEDLAHVIGVLSPIALSFYGHKHFSFGLRRPS